MQCSRCGTEMGPQQRIDYREGPSKQLYVCLRDPNHVQVHEVEPTEHVA